MISKPPIQPLLVLKKKKKKCTINNHSFAWFQILSNTTYHILLLHSCYWGKKRCPQYNVIAMHNPKWQPTLIRQNGAPATNGIKPRTCALWGYLVLFVQHWKLYCLIWRQPYPPLISRGSKRPLHATDGPPKISQKPQLPDRSRGPLNGESCM